jgi:plastocyanin
VNEDLAPHTVTQQGGSIDSGVLNPGKTFTLTVDDTFEYICAIHPSMKAKVILAG